MTYMTIGLKRKVSLALLPIDDFTDRIITGSQLHVYTMEDNITSIRKPDGYHIFCDLAGDEAEICLEGPLYQKQILKLPIVREEPTIHQVRMLPGIRYPLPQEATIVRGALPPGSVLRLFFTGQKRTAKLLDHYDPDIQGQTLFLFRLCSMSLEGRTLCICGKDKDMEFARVLDQRGNLCTLKHPLSKAYRKPDTSVYPVYEAAVYEDGSLYLPIHGLAGEENCVCILTEADGKERTFNLVLTAGGENWIPEDAWKEES